MQFFFIYYSKYTFVSAAKGDETNHFDLIYHLLGGTGEDTELPDMTVQLTTSTTETRSTDSTRSTDKRATTTIYM